MKSKTAHQARAAVVVAFVAIALFAAPAPATAVPGDPATLRSPHVFFTGNPRDNMNTYCVSRNIKLAAGKYYWESELVNDNAGTWKREAVEKTINLGAGWYSWKVCADPKEFHYVLFSELTPHNPNWHPVRSVSRGFELPSSDDYYIGSILDPLSF